MSHPNVLLFVTHDTGRFLSPYGMATVQTPHCERLAAEGVLFRQALCTAPLSAPARASLLTGRLPHEVGVNGLTTEWLGGWDLEPKSAHAAHQFRAAGYETMLCGFLHETPHWRACGFDAAMSGGGGWFNGGGDLRAHGPAIDAWLGARDRRRPFYLQVGCHETHHAWTAHGTPPDDSRGVWQPPWLAAIPEVRQEVAEMQGACRRLDDGLGAILAALDRHGVADDTIVVFTTDHGIDFPGAKGTFSEYGIGVFLIMRHPRGGWARGHQVDDLVSHLDVLPTLLDACGLPVPPGLRGQSLQPLLRGGPAAAAWTPRAFAPAEKTYHDTYDPTRCLRTATHKYIRYFEVNIFQDLRLATMTRRHFWPSPEAWRRTGCEELYDLRTDPEERINLAAPERAAAHADVLAHHRRLLLEHMRATSDPLLDGPVPSPTYARARAALAAFAAGQ